MTTLDSTTERDRLARPAVTRPRLSWTALHLACHAGAQALDRLLVDAVAPIVHSERSRGGIASWFFVRYWHGGPHLRLRLAQASPEALDRIRQQVSAALGAIPPPEPALDPEAFYDRFGVAADGVARYGWYRHGTCVDADYEPELERYGGPAAMALAEQLFEVSSDIAVSVIAATEKTQRRLAVTLDLLIGLCLRLFPERAEAVRWLRDYAAMWRYLDATVASTEADIRTGAEATFASQAAQLVPRCARLADDSAWPAPYRRWWQACLAVHREWTDLHAAGAMTVTPSGAFVSHLHMLHNRLGLTATDEVYLAWLASFALCRETGGEVDFHTDGIDAADRRYHEQSKYTAGQFVRQRPVPQPHAPRRPRHYALEVPLPAPAALTVTLFDAIVGRRTSRTGYLGSLTLADVGTLLGLAGGPVAGRKLDMDGSPVQAPVRGYPSAGMSYPAVIRLVAYAVDGLDPGCYEYLPEAHALALVGPPPSRSALAASSPFFAPPEPRIETGRVPLLLVVAADVGRMRARYGLRAYRFALLEVGHLTQNLLLVCTALGLPAAPVGGIYDDAAAQLANFDSYDEIVCYIVPIGGQRTVPMSTSVRNMADRISTDTETSA
jgi:thiopeptide-type bacteriocin biosynthesis protein